MITYEYQRYKSFTPITNRKQFAAIPRSVELKYQDVIIDSLHKRCLENNIVILDELTPMFTFVTTIVSNLIKACIYFSPECEEYMRNMKVLVVESDEINACSMLGSNHLRCSL